MNSNTSATVAKESPIAKKEPAKATKPGFSMNFPGKKAATPTRPAFGAQKSEPSKFGSAVVQKPTVGATSSGDYSGFDDDAEKKSSFGKQKSNLKSESEEIIEESLSGGFNDEIKDEYF